MWRQGERGNRQTVKSERCLYLSLLLFFEEEQGARGNRQGDEAIDARENGWRERAMDVRGKEWNEGKREEATMDVSGNWEDGKREGEEAMDVRVCRLHRNRRYED